MIGNENDDGREQKKQHSGGQARLTDQNEAGNDIHHWCAERNGGENSRGDPEEERMGQSRNHVCDAKQRAFRQSNQNETVDRCTNRVDGFLAEFELQGDQAGDWQQC